MKIIITANTSWYIYNFRLSLIKSLQNDGHQILIVAPIDDYSERLMATGCKFVPVEMDNKGTSPIRDFSLYRRFRQILRNQHPDVILSYTIKCNIYMCLAARNGKVAAFPNVSGLGTAFLSQNWINRIVKQLYRIAFRTPHTIFFQNRDDMAIFLDLGLTREDQAYLLPGSGVDLNRFTPQPLPHTENVTFLLIARMLWDKGIGEFAEAARKIQRHHPKIKFQLLGFLDVDNRSAIPRETVEGWVKEGVIEYLGTTDDVRPHITAADCVVLPSYREGTPRSLLEAAAMARPVITTDAPGCRDVVDDGKTGYLCTPRDSESLIEAIERFLSLSDSEKDEMGKSGRQKMQRQFDETIVLNAYRQVIAELGERKRR